MTDAATNPALPSVHLVNQSPRASISWRTRARRWRSVLRQTCAPGAAVAIASAMRAFLQL